MSQLAIHKVAASTGLTSRTLRHWESEGLFRSSRDAESGWRVYDEEALGRIRFTLLLRTLDIPVRNIKAVLDSGDPRAAAHALEDRMCRLDGESREISRRRALLQSCLYTIRQLHAAPDTATSFNLMERQLARMIGSPQQHENDWEESIMNDPKASNGMFRIISLPEMRLAVCNVISASPEDEALGRVIDWAETQNLMGTARIFGFNTTPFTPGQAEYGWAASVTVPEGITIPGYLIEKRLPGGLYATFASTNEIYDSWQALVRQIKESDEVESDNTRLCLEEHIRSGNPKGSGNEYYLNLLEPVKRK